MVSEKTNAELNYENVIVSGYSKLPEGSLLHSAYGGSFSVILKVKRTTGEILAFDCGTKSDVQLLFLNELLCGESISSAEGMLRIEQLLEHNFSGTLRKPIFSGIVACKRRYDELVLRQRKLVE